MKIYKLLLQQNIFLKHKKSQETKTLEREGKTLALDHINTMLSLHNIRKANKEYLQKISDEWNQSNGKMTEDMLDQI